MQHHHYHLRHSAKQQQQVFVGRMRNNQPTSTVVMNQRHQQRRALGKSSKSKSQKAKSSKHSRDDGYHHYSNSYDDGDNLVMSGDFANQYGMHDDGGEAEGDNDEDVAAPVQAGISFDILFDNNNNNADSSSSSAMTEDGDAIQGEGSDAEAQEFSSFNDRIDNEEEGGGGSASTLATSTNQEVSTESIDGFPTTTTPNSTNIEVLKKWEIKPSGRTSAIAAAGVISLVSLGSVFFVTVGLIIHAKQSKRAAAVAGAAANNNNSVEDSSVDASSIWSANEGGGEDFIGDIAAAGGGGGEQMPMASPQPAGVSSIAAMGMASPLALQLSGRSGAGAFTFE